MKGNKRHLRFKKMSKNKRNFISDMKWNGKAKGNPKISRTIPEVTCGAFGSCKYKLAVQES